MFDTNLEEVAMNELRPIPNRSRRSTEQGAALVMTILIATLLLVTGGALIQLTSMSAANAFEATAETEAYYAAEAGLQAALNALRGNAAPTDSAMPTGMTRIDFRNAALPASSNDCPAGLGGDPSTVARLSRWLPYTNRQTAGTRVLLQTDVSGNQASYDRIVSLPPGDTMPISSLVQPGRLLIRSTGYARGGATKKMSMIVSRNAFDPAVPAMMTLIGAPNGTPAMSFESGSSAAHVYSSIDNATSGHSGLPAFGTTNATDNGIATTQSASNTTTTPAAAVLESTAVPSYLRSPAAARAFLDQMQAAAMLGAAQSPASATYLPNGGSGNPTGFTFVKGDYTMGSGSGSGLLIVTGELTTNGGTDFNGLVLVIGSGYVNRNGGGGGVFYGANFIANVDWPVAFGNTPRADFGAPFFQFNGAGNATMQYDSTAVANALRLLPAPVLGVSEY